MSEFSKEFLSRFEDVSVVCKEVSQFCGESGIDLGISKEIELCLTEALNNVIIHSYKHQYDKRINLFLKTDDEVIELEIRDYGESRKNLDKPSLEFDPDDIETLPEGGMGLFIIDQIMDETNYHTDGTINIFSMKKRIS